VGASDMSGKTVVITGGNSGIGKETAVALAGAGATVVITARDRSRGEAAVSDIRSRSGSDDVDVVVFDLGNLASTEAGAAAINDRCPRIDVLVNNAGVVLSDRHETADGFESTFAINHLGPFLLTQRLLDRIVASGPSRIVNVSSNAHRSARNGIPFDDLQATRRYSGMSVYGESKLANILFTTELARRLRATKTTANCLHPGVVATGYGRDGDTRGFMAFGLGLIKPFILTAEKGARTSIYLASSPEVADVSGGYFVKCKQRKPSKPAQDAAAAARLWDISNELIGTAKPSVGDQ
jgi:NAD(P)-dependent dehydrogenase (short-subunit alcohol dehydrogenase family)